LMVHHLSNWQHY